MTPDNITFTSWSISWLVFIFLVTGTFLFDNWQLALSAALISYVLPFGGISFVNRITWGRFKRKINQWDYYI